MKADLHPTYHSTVTVTCLSCNHSFESGSTKEALTVELCSKCHPFFTGTQKIIDSARRVEKFQERLTKKPAKPARTKRAKITEKQAKRSEKQKEEIKKLA